MRKIIAAAAAAILLAPLPAFAADARADDAIAAFLDLCLSAPLGQPSLKMEADRFIRRSLTPVLTAQLSQGRMGGTGYALKSNRSEAVLMVVIDPIGSCFTRVAEADEKSLQMGFAAAMDRVAKAGGGNATTLPPRNFTVEGVTLTLAGWSLPVKDKTAEIVLTTAPRLVGNSQHMMKVTVKAGS